MTLNDLNNLQVEDILRWPLKTRLIALGIVVALFGVGVWYWFIHPENTRYGDLVQQENSLKEQIRTKQLLAANLPLYQAQITEMKARFESLLRQLPNRAQIPSLLDDVTLAGRSRGLEFELFQPLPEVRKAFYAEVPVRIKVVGTYDSMGQFAAAVAAMPRIVTLDGIDVSRVPNSGPDNAAKAQAAQKLVLQCTATTYRYLGSGERGEEAKK